MLYIPLKCGQPGPTFQCKENEEVGVRRKLVISEIQADEDGTGLLRLTAGTRLSKLQTILKVKDFIARMKKLVYTYSKPHSIMRKKLKINIACRKCHAKINITHKS